jgi:hypothetical protein
VLTRDLRKYWFYPRDEAQSVMGINS